MPSSFVSLSGTQYPIKTPIITPATSFKVAHRKGNVINLNIPYPASKQRSIIIPDATAFLYEGAIHIAAIIEAKAAIAPAAKGAKM